VIKIHLCALLLAVGIAAPAFADDWDSLSDAIGTRTEADDSAADTDSEESSDDAEALRNEDGSAANQQLVKSKAVDLDEKAAEQKTDRAPDPNRFSGTDGEGKRNVLGPLWGVPSGSPVMQNIDPEMEKQYAVNGEGRLVPEPDSDELEDQQRAAAKADRDRVRAEERAAKERRWAEEAAERQRERDENRAAKGDAPPLAPEVREVEEPEQDRDEAQAEETEPSNDSADSGDDDERETINIGCRGGDED
jgi:hypothetical protein